MRTGAEEKKPGNAMDKLGGFEPMSQAELLPKLYAACMKCKKVQLKRDMTTLFLKEPGEAGNRTTRTVGSLCGDCLPDLTERYEIREGRDGGKRDEKWEKVKRRR